MRKGLTARQVETQQAAGLFGDGGGLYLQVTASGAKSWIYRFALAGRRRDMGLGSARTVTLAQARRKAEDARRLVEEGRDPIAVRAEQEAAAKAAAVPLMTFGQCAEAYIQAHEAGWRRAREAEQWRRTLATHAASLTDRPVSEIDTAAVLRVLTPIWAKVPETASKVRGRVEAILDWARVHGHRDDAVRNPATWKGNLAFALPSKRKVAPVQHHPSLPYVDMPAFWPRLEMADGLGAKALQFIILTAGRSSEIRGARWAEIDMEGAVWTVPTGRMKGAREHRVPLSAPALALLRRLATVRTGDLVFPGRSPRQPLSGMAVIMALRRMGIDVTVHGFQSTFRVWAAEQTSFPREVCEAALAHVSGDRVEAAYQRSDFFEKRRQLMAAWGRYVEGAEAGNVTPLRGGRHG